MSHPDSTRLPSLPFSAGPLAGETNHPVADDEVLLRERPKTKKPSLYQVLLHNDDYTTMEYVVHVLMKYFQKNETEATDIMLKVHKTGIGIAGVYTYEVAETKVV